VSESEAIEVTVGKKGEIYTTQELRDRSGITPGGKVVAVVVDGKLVIEPKRDALSLLKMPRAGIRPVTLKELREHREELAKDLEER
jgi:bifunctional DNA-binding transcriptional regulator/antitoxin component of YhaV-PrlF toxin-antitoxin module